MALDANLQFRMGMEDLQHLVQGRLAFPVDGGLADRKAYRLVDGNPVLLQTRYGRGPTQVSLGHRSCLRIGAAFGVLDFSRRRRGHHGLGLGGAFDGLDVGGACLGFLRYRRPNILVCDAPNSRRPNLGRWRLAPSVGRGEHHAILGLRKASDDSDGSHRLKRRVRR